MQQRGRGAADRHGFPGQSHRRAERALAACGPSGAFSPHGCTTPEGVARPTHRAAFPPGCPASGRRTLVAASPA
jgi:hypothetical protein